MPSPTSIRTRTIEGTTVAIDVTGQRLRADSITAEKWDAPLAPRPQMQPGFVAAAVLSYKAKRFDDGMMAAIALATQTGRGKLPSKREVLEALAVCAADDASPAAALLHAALSLGGARVEAPTALAAAAAALEAEFRESPEAKPLGVYTWSPELTAIFRQDRLLQTPLVGAEVRGFGERVRSDQALVDRYRRLLALTADLTNPFVLPDLTHAGTAERLALFPASRSHETELAKRLYGDRSIPDGFNLMEELIAGVRAGDIDLAPREGSGYLDQRAWALEALIRPDGPHERERLELTDAYRSHLAETFRAFLALHRETHVKQLESPLCGAAGVFDRPIVVAPAVEVEPLPTFYLRSAEAYRFLHTVLSSAFGPDLAGITRVTETGPVAPSLAEELDQMIAIFHGAHLQSLYDLGVDPSSAFADRSAATDRAAFASFRSRQISDPDLSVDPRMMVPVFFDVERRMWKVWVVLGFRGRPLRYFFATPPTVRLLDRPGLLSRVLGKEQPRIVWGADVQLAPSPSFHEIYVPRLLDRDEVRRLCDRHPDEGAALAALRAG